MKRKNPKVIQERNVTTLSMKERYVKVLGLRLKGLTTRAIGDKLGVSPMTISRDLRAILDELNMKQLEEAREFQMLELARLDELLTPVWEKAIRGDPIATETALKIIRQRVNIIGLGNIELKLKLALDAEIEVLLSIVEEEVSLETYLKILARIGRKEIIEKENQNEQH